MDVSEQANHMGGYLKFGIRFEPMPADRKTQGYYYSNDEETWDLAYGSIERMIVEAEQLGIPREAWPNFIDQDGRTDLVSPQDIWDRNLALASSMLKLTEEQVTCNEHLLLVWCQIGKGKLLFIDH